MIKRVFREYWLSVVAISFMTIVVFCNHKTTALNIPETNGKASKLSQLGSYSTKLEHIGSIGFPILSYDTYEQIIYRKGYVVSYNCQTRLPNWVAWHLTSEHLKGNIRRPGNAFHEDFDVPVPRATNSDYKGSGWSRGHMCPAGDNKWDSEAMYDSFLFSNICPQHSKLNSGVWNQIEIASRNWAEKYGDIYVVCGPVLFNKEHETIGENQVVVPKPDLDGTPVLYEGEVLQELLESEHLPYILSLEGLERCGSVLDLILPIVDFRPVLVGPLLQFLFL